MKPDPKAQRRVLLKDDSSYKYIGEKTNQEINWSEVARTAIKSKTAQLKILKTISAKSKPTEKDALELGRKINKLLHENIAHTK